MSRKPTPPCFANRRDWRFYRVLKQKTPFVPDSSFCFDCTPEFKKRMLALKKCMHPETEFVDVIELDGDRENRTVHGIWPTTDMVQLLEDPDFIRIEPHEE